MFVLSAKDSEARVVSLRRLQLRFSFHHCLIGGEAGVYWFACAGGRRV